MKADRASDLPRPLPDRFPARPPTFEVPAGTRIYRLFFPTTRDGEPRRWSFRRSRMPPAYRFDHLDAGGAVDVRTVWYGAFEPSTAVREVLDRVQTILIRNGELRHIVELEVLKPFSVLDLRGARPSRFPARGARSDDRRGDQRLATSRDYAGTQEWARAFHAQYPTLCGIVWRSRIDSEGSSVVLNERLDFARHLAPCDGFPCPLRDVDSFWKIVDEAQNEIFFDER